MKNGLVFYFSLDQKVPLWLVAQVVKELYPHVEFDNRGTGNAYAEYLYQVADYLCCLANKEETPFFFYAARVNNEEEEYGSFGDY